MFFNGTSLLNEVRKLLFLASILQQVNRILVKLGLK